MSGSVSDEVSAELDSLAAAMTQRQSDPTAGGPATGVAEWDRRLAQISRSVLASMDALEVPGRPEGNLYVATRLYRNGGHTALIGDFVRALGPAQARLVLTEPLEDGATRLPPDILARLALSEDQVIILPAGTRGMRLRTLLALVREYPPHRLFLFHHPDDPIPCAAALPELAEARVLVHHADATCSFGLYLDGVRIIDLNPSALGPTAISGLESALLPLTCPDPGPRPRGFLTEGGLVTASSGSAHKFGGRYRFGYAETVARILRVTAGLHLHIGPLGDEARAGIADAMRSWGVAESGFLHVAHTSSLATTLWEQGCDVYLASFPVDGARARVEVLASGTPYLHHSQRQAPVGDATPELDEHGLGVWRDLEGLEALLRRWMNPETLVALGARSRQVYEEIHHPDRFAARLAGILDGSIGPEPVSDAQRARALERLRAPSCPSPPTEPGPA